MRGLGPENAPCGVGGSKRDSRETDEADAVEAEFLAPDASSDLGLERCGDELGGSCGGAAAIGL